MKVFQEKILAEWVIDTENLFTPIAHRKPEL